MLKAGHWGIAMLCYAPIAFGAISQTKASFPLVVVGAALTSGLCMLPDIDQQLPFVSHRGVTHTIWFALLVGGILGGGVFIIAQYASSLITTYVAPTMQFTGLYTPVNLGWFFGITGLVVVVSHLLGDWLTVMGIRPYAPLWRHKHKLGIVHADNTFANWVLYIIGGIGIIVAILAGLDILPFA